MTECTGNGKCFELCECICYDIETDIDHEVCSCGHRSHNVRFCRKGPCVHNCEFIKCKNFNICKTSSPKWYIDEHPGSGVGLCFNCWAYRGKMRNVEEPADCGICYENKILIELDCHPTHKLCLECWDKTIDSKPYPSRCPICRKALGSWKFNWHR